MNRRLCGGRVALVVGMAVGGSALGQVQLGFSDSEIGEIKQQGTYFSNQTLRSGIDVEQRCDVGTSVCQIVPYAMAGGGVTGDFDRDGDQDLLILGGGLTPDRLYINDGTGIFTDGDLRRTIINHPEQLDSPIRDVMTKDPTTLSDISLVRDAVRLVREQDRRHQIGRAHV